MDIPCLPTSPSTLPPPPAPRHRFCDRVVNDAVITWCLQEKDHLLHVEETSTILLGTPFGDELYYDQIGRLKPYRR